MVNLADPGGKRFLKATIKLKVSSPHVADECKLRSFEMRDLVLTLLTSKESDEVMTPEDKLVLKKQIMEAHKPRASKGAGPGCLFHRLSGPVKAVSAYYGKDTFPG